MHLGLWPQESWTAEQRMALLGMVAEVLPASVQGENKRKERGEGKGEGWTGVVGTSQCACIVLCLGVQEVGCVLKDEKGKFSKPVLGRQVGCC